MTKTNNSYFPFLSIREGQKEFMEDVRDSVESEKILIAHAPTGIGKTVAALVPALQYALENEKTIFFLTSKRSQHKIAIDTLRMIKQHAKLNFVAVDVTSKQSMCPRATSIYREYYSLFNEFCKSEQKNKRCRYFLKNDEEALRRIRDEILHVEELYGWCTGRGVCPYKAALEVAERADVVVCDYNYLFSPDIAEMVLEKIEAGLDDLIVIVDEAHNLPDRIRNNLSNTLRMSTITSAAREIRYIDREMYGNLMELEKIFTKLALEASKNKAVEIAVERDFLLEEMEKVLRRRIEAISYDDFVNTLQSIAEDLETTGEAKTAGSTKDVFSAEEKRILKTLKKNLYNVSGTTGSPRYKKEKETAQRNIINLAEFLDGWRTREKCVRIYSLAQRENPMLYFKLLDPSVISAPIIARVHATIMMSGTLCPTEMYADVLGVTPERIRGKEVAMMEYKSPFPEENRQIVVTKELTTKYTKRGEEMYKKVAEKIGEVAQYVKGGMAVFFPSYALLKSIAAYLPEDVSRRAMVERREMKKEEKNMLYESLRDTNDGILLAVQGGSFSEGMDYESNTLKAIIVVGLPLSPPTLEVKTIEGYYTGKYGAEKGRLYGYLYPAVTKVLQAAGRGIRSEQDRCIIVLMDYRFAQFPYKQCLPSDYNVTFTDRAEVLCRKFFFT
ncbi:MAG TPA: ATP-dependent DNA helicase [Candidatus Bathyarchaeia archaeon]|nr:ATP-dependent DNA helicase [Candidatus Bathyarchaeia archaeon]